MASLQSEIEKYYPLRQTTHLTCKNLSKAGFVCLAILIASSARFTLRMKAVYVSITDFLENWRVDERGNNNNEWRLLYFGVSIHDVRPHSGRLDIKTGRHLWKLLQGK